MREYPKKFVYGRTFRIKVKNDVSKKLLNVWFYSLGLKALEGGKIRIQHVKSIIRLVKRKFKNIWIRYNISLNIPVTKKPTEARMGKGKGQRSHWEFAVRKGQLLLEVGGGDISMWRLLRCLFLIGEKLPFSTKIVKIKY
jgi:large subunit ribosomal protein L16